MSSYPFRFFVILFCLGLFAGACSKSDEGPGEGKDGSGQYFIRYKANGINHEYTAGKLVYAIQPCRTRMLSNSLSKVASTKMISKGMPYFSV